MTGKLLFLDIETIPDQREGAASAARSRISAPSNYKDPIKIGAYIAERAQEAWLSTALDGSYGEVFCIGYAVDGEPPEVLVRPDAAGPFTPAGERALLQEFWTKVAPRLSHVPTWVGHNILKFDLRFLWRRHVINAVAPHRPLPYNASPWSADVYDTMLAWSGDRTSYVSLSELLKIVRIDSLDGISGADVWELVQSGDIDPVIEHCLVNVDDVRALWERMEMRSAATRT